jgi:hypothetical protein
MQIGKWARVLCTEDIQNGALKGRWIMGVLSAIRSNKEAEIMNPLPLRAGEMLNVTNPGPYICECVIQVGDWIRAYCTEDAQNGERKGHAMQGVLSRFRPDGAVEVMTSFYPAAPGPYICNPAWDDHDAEKAALNWPASREFIKKWRKRLVHCGRNNMGVK